MDDNQLIDELGGTSKVADMCEVTTGAVSQWRKDGIPKPWRKYFQAIRPDLFPNEKADRRKDSRRQRLDRREDGK